MTTDRTTERTTDQANQRAASAIEPALPALPLEAWRDTRETLHRWMQIVGKIRLQLTPVINHWWNVPLYVSARGFTTSEIPYGNDRWFEIEFDVVDDLLRIVPSDRAPRQLELRPRSVADLYHHLMAELRAADLDVQIWTMPVEIDDPVRFELDEAHAAYDKEYVRRFWRIVGWTTEVLTTFRARFIGKASPVHFFWGSFDVAASRFSGRRAPPFEGNTIDREAYSHETSSVGWWPGDHRLPVPSYYSYLAPEPTGFRDAAITTPHAYYNAAMKGFYLPYDAVRAAADPEALLLDFCQQTYVAGAELAHWERGELERGDVAPPGARAR